MHEWALAESVLESVRAHAAGRRVLKVVLRFGELQAVDREVFMAGIEELSAGTVIDTTVFEIETEKAEVSCGACGARRLLEALMPLDDGEREAVHFVPEAVHAFLRCAACGSADLRVESGRGVTIAVIEVDDAGADGATP